MLAIDGLIWNIRIWKDKSYDCFFRTNPNPNSLLFFYLRKVNEDTDNNK